MDTSFLSTVGDIDFDIDNLSVLLLLLPLLDDGPTFIEDDELLSSFWGPPGVVEKYLS
jgi:hypothetical protein